MNSILDPKNSGKTVAARVTRQCGSLCPRGSTFSLTLALLALCYATVPELDAQTARLVRADYQNELSLNATNNSTNSSSLATFSGHIVVSSTNGIPTNGTGSLILMESSFGQPFATDLPFPDFVVVNLSNALTYLYPPTTATRTELDTGGTNHWAFRYKWLLYSNDAGGVFLTESFPDSWYGDAERANVEAALDLLRRALAYAPYDRTLRHAYLDVFYDQAVAEQSGIKSQLADIAKYRIGEVALGPDEFIIDKEIQGYTNILSKLQRALTNYGQIFNDFSGVDVTTLDTSATFGTPFGYFMFQQEQPFRNQMAPQFLIGTTLATLDPQTGQPLTNSTPAVLFAGYKDFVMLMTLLQDSTTYAAELARLYGTRGTGADRTNAYALIRQVQTDVPAEVQSLTGMFAPTAFPPGDASGARAAINGVLFSVAELDGVRAFLDGRANPLGFDPNFLVLIQEAPGLPSTSNTTPFDSFDSLLLWLRATSTAPLSAADTKYATAQTAYDAYRGYADQVQTELASIDDTYATSYTAITGYQPDDPTFTGDNPAEGSELAQSKSTVSNLLIRLSYLQTNSASLQSNLSLATLTINDAVDKTNQIDALLESYFDKTDSAWDEIHAQKTAAAVSQATAEAVYAAAGAAASGTPEGEVAAVVAGVAGAANAAVQGEAANRISVREEELDHDSSTHDADMQALSAYPAVLQALSGYQSIIQSQASNASDVQDVNNQIAQEVVTQGNLQRELESIRLNHESARAQNASRYYADPIHSFRAQAALLAADQAFRRAQRWVFYTQRALEYKWNKDFTWTQSGAHSYDKGTIFKLLNAQELDDLVGALEDFNTQNLIAFSREESDDRISLVDDLLLPFPGPGSTDTGLRRDPSGNLVPKEALFRRILLGQVSSPNVTVDANFRTIRLDTFVLLKNLGTFFNGPTYGTNGNLLSLGKHLDKIQWVKFNIMTTNPPGELYQGATFRYSGDCYIRVASPPCHYDTSAPGALFHAFPFQYFYPDPQISGAFLSQTSQDALAKMAFSLNSWALPNGQVDPALQNSNLENSSFKELSIAATGLELRIPLSAPIDLNLIRDIEIWVHHLYVSDLPCTP